MVYGRILYNNIKEFTPKWFPTVPYSQTVKPVFGRKPQVVSAFNASPAGKTLWRNFAFVFQRQSWAWQIFIVGVAFAFYHIVRDPILLIYEANNTHRGYNAAITKEKAYKKKIQDQQEADEAAQQSEE